VRAWVDREPGRLLGRGHPVGDFLEAYEWRVQREEPGLLELLCHVPDQVRNPRGQLFGGFTPTYVDLIALLTVRSGEELPEARFRSWLATTSMRVEYFEPVVGPEFRVESRIVKHRGRTLFVETRFLDLAGELLVFATTTLREVPDEGPLGDA
jgi:acyl-coenzyme A thioesterase PaaI-like protein